MTSKPGEIGAGAGGLGIHRDEDGNWQLVGDEKSRAGTHKSYWEAIPRYFSLTEPIFSTAESKSEFEFLLALLGARGHANLAHDPYETTKRAISGMLALQRGLSEEDDLARHLQLWLYGHIMEASEPYKLMMSLVNIANGERHQVNLLEANSGRPLTPGQKIASIRDKSRDCALPDPSRPCQEIWDRGLRNSSFHADYAVYGPQVIVPDGLGIRILEDEEVVTIVNRALAWHCTVLALREAHLSAYDEPTVIDVHSEFSKDPAEKAVVIVREGEGATGIKDNWTASEIAAGKVSFRIGRFTQAEIDALDADVTLALLPPQSDAD